jgi:hypothetical protein
VLPALLKQTTPLLGGTNPLHCRLGAVEAMAALMQTLQRQLVPYTVLLVVPLLRRMSDPAAAVRRRAALCFGGLTALLPLAQGLPLPQGLDDVQQKAAQQDAEFLSQLLDNKRVEDYTLPVKLKVWLQADPHFGIIIIKPSDPYMFICVAAGAAAPLPTGCVCFVSLHPAFGVMYLCPGLCAWLQVELRPCQQNMCALPLSPV